MASPEQHNEPQTDAGPRALAARAPIGIAELDREGRVVWANDVLAAHLVPGRDPGDAVGTDAFAFVHPDDRPQLARVLDTSTDLAVRCRTIAPAMAGLVNVRFTPLPGSGGDARIGMYVEDASAHDRRLARAITVSSERYVTLLQHVRDAITVVDENGVIVANLGIAETLLGWDPNAWIGRSIFDFAHPDEEAEIRAAFEALLRVPGVPVMRDYRARQADGTFAWIHFTAINLLQDPEVGAVILVTRNVSRERTAAALQAAQAEVFEAIAKGVGLHEVLAKLTEILETFVARCWASVWTIDDDRVQPWASSLPAALVERLSGREVGGLRGAFAVVRQTGEPVAAADVTSSPWYAGFADELVSAGVRAVAAFPVRDPERGVIDGVVGVHLADGRELTEFERAVAEGVARLTEIALQRHRTELELSRLAHYDKLTGLPNRALLQDRLDDAIQLARHHVTSLAVMFCDMDNFKIVNDSLGHAAGDQILVGFAERLRKLLRPSDTIGRFGGDEFVVLLENVAGASDAIQVAERLLDDLRRPFQIGDNTVFLTVSIGIALSHGGRGSGEMLLRDADSAMYQAKDRGRSRIEIYDAGLPERAAARLHLESDLRSALDQEQFRLLWQPKVSLAAGRIVSAEALVRWNHPERGTVLPAEFVHIAEETELIREVGEWVLERAIGEHARWLDRFGDDAPECIAVNVSALQLTAPSAVDTVVRVLERFGLPARRLMLELTESVLMAEGSDAAQLLLRLRDLGVRIAIDDFGTGYSSLSYLHQYPVDAVKLDRSFVTGIRADGEGSPIARAVINMAHALGISVTAEGVETPDQLDGLRALGCDWVQGYLLGRPMTADEFSAVLARRPRFDPGTRLPLGPG